MGLALVGALYPPCTRTETYAVKVYVAGAGYVIMLQHSTPVQNTAQASGGCKG